MPHSLFSYPPFPALFVLVFSLGQKHKGKMSDNFSYATSYLQFYQSTNIYISAFSVRAILLFHVSTFVLFLELQKWHERRSIKTVSHFEVFTCHLAAMEFICAIMFLFHITAEYYNLSIMSCVSF
ncbi:hypothetical protein ILYODFUR_039001 [Ilyodon furcidens]|uniref:Uncharacterized protein n=1 Tax=Ilyodon furcidens TaxID=33524 RepID=A0ABV0V9R0_9TELE